MMQERVLTPDSLWQTWGLYGKSGAGKTSIAVTAPKPYVLDSNQGLLSVAGRPGLEHVRGDTVRQMRDLDDVYDKITGTHPSKNWSKRYDTLIYDHFEDIQSLIMDELGQRALEKDDRREIDEWQQKEYGTMGNKLRRYLRKAKKLKQHKILIMASTTDFDTGMIQPSLIGAMKQQLPFFTDHLAYLRIGKKGVRYLHLDPSDEWEAKTRAWWFTPEQKKIKVPHGDTQFMTRLIQEIQAGPQAKRSSKKAVPQDAAPAGRTRHSVAAR